MKKAIAVLFGGQSSEHEVSCISASTIIEQIDLQKYDLYLVGITRDGRWLLAGSLEDVKSGRWMESRTQAFLLPDAGCHGLLLRTDDCTALIHLDVVFPALHGLYGEDGTVQGLLELSGIPYVGCGVLASAVSMDKIYTKIIVSSLGIGQAAYVPVQRCELAEPDAVISRIEAQLAYPVFVKPSNAGSSRGVSRADDRAGLLKALELAANEDSKILVEETIVGRELECAVFGGETAKASGEGEILATAQFYDYEAKYHDATSRTVVHPELPEGKTEEIRTAAVRIFNAVGGQGLSRVDFFLQAGTSRVIFNEINTLPGFTSISMYPMLWEAEGVSKKQLVEDLINTAFIRRH